ncbi:MAG: sugar transferase [Deltaproteobacteria bacterium]|nr:sugar transferase [Deltaproteobacteria bacterium]
MERPARRDERGRPAAGAAGLHRAVPSRGARLHARHKVKAGMTGWAQVHGWRGNTSLQERIEHDIHYIQNWSLSLDVKILFLTGLHLLFGRNAY